MKLQCLWFSYKLSTVFGIRREHWTGVPSPQDGSLTSPIQSWQDDKLYSNNQQFRNSLLHCFTDLVSLFGSTGKFPWHQLTVDTTFKHFFMCKFAMTGKIHHLVSNWHIQNSSGLRNTLVPCDQLAKIDYKQWQTERQSGTSTRETTQLQPLYHSCDGSIRHEAQPPNKT